MPDYEERKKMVGVLTKNKVTTSNGDKQSFELVADYDSSQQTSSNNFVKIKSFVYRKAKNYLGPSKEHYVPCPVVFVASSKCTPIASLWSRCITSSFGSRSYHSVMAVRMK